MRSWSWKREARRLARRIAEAGGTPPAEESSRRDTRDEFRRRAEAGDTSPTGECSRRVTRVDQDFC